MISLSNQAIILVYYFIFRTVAKEDLESRVRHSNFYRLVTAYREHAHKSANLDPIAINKPSLQVELEPNNYGLSPKDVVSYRGILNVDKPQGTVQEAIGYLNDIYCGSLGVEFSYLEVKYNNKSFLNGKIIN